VKKCASCTKDLPDAALHCVFCGAKQPPAPAVAGSVAKTVMGHASNEMIEQLKAQAAAAQQRQPQAPAPAPYTPPAPAPMPMPMPAPIAPAPAPAPIAPRPAPVPSAGSVAPTMFVPGSGPPGPSGPAPAHPGSAPTMIAGPGGLPPAPAAPGLGMPPGPGPSMGMPPAPAMPSPAPIPPVAAPIPSAAPPYLASRTAARAGRPIEPWKDSLRLMMFIWGGALIAAFMVPVTLEPDVGFMFQVIIDGEGTEKLPPLLMAAIGLLSLVLGAIPMSPSPRGLIAALLALTGILVPELLGLSKGEFGLGQILILVNLVGVMTLIPGLLLRSEYQDSIMPRIMVTIGALCVLAALLVPQNDNIPLIEAFKALIDAPGKAKVKAIFMLAPALLALLSLLAWLPAPGGAGAKVFAWLWIVWGAVQLYTFLIVNGNIGAAVEGSPYLALASWIGGGLIGAGSAYLALLGFGLASVLGKKLE